MRLKIWSPSTKDVLAANRSNTMVLSHVLRDNILLSHSATEKLIRLQRMMF